MDHRAKNIRKRKEVQSGGKVLTHSKITRQTAICGSLIITKATTMPYEGVALQTAELKSKVYCKDHALRGGSKPQKCYTPAHVHIHTEYVTCDKTHQRLGVPAYTRDRRVDSAHENRREARSVVSEGWNPRTGIFLRGGARDIGSGRELRVETRLVLWRHDSKSLISLSRTSD